MIKVDMRNQLLRLESTYKANKYSDEVISRMWVKLGYMSIERFTQVVNVILESHKGVYLPTVQQISEVNIALKYQEYDKSKEQEKIEVRKYWGEEPLSMQDFCSGFQKIKDDFQSKIVDTTWPNMAGKCAKDVSFKL